MKQLFLMRHATSPMGHGIRDMQRSLSDFGQEEAEKIGRYFTQTYKAPDLILCSGAARTRQTLQYFLAAQKKNPIQKIEYKDMFYHGSVDDYIHALQDIPDTCTSALIVGHNPTIPFLVNLLCHETKSPDDLMLKLSRGYHPATLAALTFSHDNWLSITPHSGILSDITAPADIP